MIDKQIIIDGVDVSGCCNLEKDCDNFYCQEYGRNVYCNSNPNCHYKLYKRKEQECERLQNIINEAQNSKLDLKSFLVGEAIQNEYEQQLNQLKEANEDLLSIQYELADNNKRLRQTLTETKEIAENGKRFAERYMTTGEQKANVLIYANAILQKISEVEDETTK